MCVVTHRRRAPAANCAAVNILYADDFLELDHVLGTLSVIDKTSRDPNIELPRAVDLTPLITDPGCNCLKNVWLEFDVQVPRWAAGAAVFSW